MLKLIVLCIITCINSLYKTVFYSVESFSGDSLTFSTLWHETLDRVKDSFIQRIDPCVNVEGEQFEHLL